MSSLFLHLEDRGTEEPVENQAPGSLDESETATARVAEVVEEARGIEDEDREAEDLDERVQLAEGLAEDVEPVVTEGRGLDKVGMANLLIGMRRIAGIRGRHLVGNNIRMEAIDSGNSGRLEQTKIVFEDLKDTLKSAWAAIKAAFKKAWAKVKTWYIKTFDASKKLKSRAEKIRTRAENSASTIDKKTFTFSGAGTLAIDGKLKEGNIVEKLGTLKDLSDTILNKVKSDDVGKAAEELATALGDVDNESKFSGAVNTIHEKIVSKLKLSLGSDVADSKVKASLGDSKEVRLSASSELPGGKLIVQVTGIGGGNEISAKIAVIRRTRATFVNAKDKVKEASTEVTTLTSSQVAKVCDHVIDIADNIYDFKAGWENRDKDTEKTISELDKAFSEIQRDKDAEGSAQRYARGIASAATGLLRRDSAFKASFVSYLMNVGNVALSYCEGSMRQYKK